MSHLTRIFCSLLSLIALAMTIAPNAFARSDDGSVLLFPPTPIESVTKPRLQDSSMKWGTPKQRLPADAPNILIILIDDMKKKATGDPSSSMEKLRPSELS